MVKRANKNTALVPGGGNHEILIINCLIMFSHQNFNINPKCWKMTLKGVQNEDDWAVAFISQIIPIFGNRKQKQNIDSLASLLGAPVWKYPISQSHGSILVHKHAQGDVLMFKSSIKLLGTTVSASSRKLRLQSVHNQSWKTEDLENWSDECQFLLWHSDGLDRI